MPQRRHIIDLSSRKRHVELSPFLNLPPELRNRIYDFATESRIENLIFHPSSWSAEHLDPPKPQFLGLTQVCRLVRSEFRPIYLRKKSVGIRAYDLPAYLNTFFPQQSDLDIGHRRIDVFLAAGNWYYSARKYYVDVLPLFKMHTGQNRTMCKFKLTAKWPSLSAEGAHLQWMLHHADPKWVHDIRTGNIKEVRVYGAPFSADRYVQILLKADCTSMGKSAHKQGIVGKASGDCDQYLRKTRLDSSSNTARFKGGHIRTVAYCVKHELHSPLMGC